MHAYMRGPPMQRRSKGGSKRDKHYDINHGRTRLTVCVRNPKWLSLCGWRRSSPAPSAGAGEHGLAPRAPVAPRMRRVDPTDERLDIVILDWYRFALETA